MLDPAYLRRLAFVRYLYGLGVRQSRQPEPLHSVSLLLFHDALELFLSVGCDFVTAKQPKEFEGYFAAIEEKRPTLAPLPERPGLARFNKARVALKHHGLHPSGSEVEAHRRVVAAFLQATSQSLFGLDFDAISLVDLVDSEKVRERLRQAESLATSDRAQAAQHLSEAFGLLVADFEIRCTYVMGPNALTLDVSNFRSSSPVHRVDNGFDPKVYDLARAVSSLGEFVQTMSTGIDMRRYRRFLAMVGRGRWTAARFTAQEARFCTDFVVETALTLQRFLRELEAKGDEDGTDS